MAEKKHPKTRYGPEKTIHLTVAGMNYRITASGQKKMHDAAPILVELQREPENNHDENAVAIHLLTHRPGLHIGYVPREIAAELAPLMDDGDVIFPTAWLTEVNHKAGSGQLLIVFRKKLRPKA